MDPGRQLWNTQQKTLRNLLSHPDDHARAIALFLTWDEGAVVEGARGLLDYWGGLTIAGLLLMPPTRHNFVHLNEAWMLKGKALRVK